MATEEDTRRAASIEDYRRKLLKHKENDSKVRSLRDSVKVLKKDYDKTEDDLKALQSVGQIIGEVLRQLDAERCESPALIYLHGPDLAFNRDLRHMHCPS